MPSSTTGFVNEVFGSVGSTVDAIIYGGSGTLVPANALIGGMNASAFRQINFPTGINPGATGADNVLAVFTLPAGTLDGIASLTSQRGLLIDVTCTIASSANTKTLKIIFNATTAVVGTTVTGGTTIATSGSQTTVTAINLKGIVYKTGAAGSNTQVGWSLGGSTSGAALFATAPAAIAAVESSPILVAITGNAGTTATDIALNAVEVTGLN